MIPKKLGLIIFAVLVTNSLFTDLPLFPQKTATHSLMFLFAPVIFLFLLALNKFKFKISDKITRVFIIYSISTFLISYMNLIIYIFSEDFIVYEINVMVKFVEAFFSITLLHMLVYYLYVNSISRIRYRTFSSLILAVFTILTIVGIVEYFRPEALEIFHVHPKNYDRLRLLALEPSQAVLIFSIVFFLSFLLVQKLYIKAVISVTYLLILYLIASKGIFISMTLSSLLLLILNVNLSYGFLLLLFNFVVSVYLFFTVTIPQLIPDIEYFTSFATRASGMLSAIYILLVYPLGLGYGTYIGLYPEIIEKVSSYISGLFLHGLNLEEVRSMVDYGEYIGAKATLPQLIMFNGVLGFLFFFFLFYRTYTASKYVSDKFGKINGTAYKFFTLTLFIQLAIGTEFNLLYIMWLYIAFGEVVREDRWTKT